ncbi:XkdW family protein [Paenibacillus larvae]|nr:XkdW family protein [Paenibacillus larvae]MDT2295110.1 XkdW family protein [Paenibacillus larvae]
MRKIERIYQLAITGLFPEADSSRDFIVMDDGYGNQRIAEWHLDAPIPTKEELREGYKKYRGGSEETKAGEPKGTPIRKRPATWRLLGRAKEIRGMHLRRSPVSSVYVAPADKARKRQRSRMYRTFIICVKWFRNL